MLPTTTSFISFCRRLWYSPRSWLGIQQVFSFRSGLGQGVAKHKHVGCVDIDVDSLVVYSTLHLYGHIVQLAWLLFRSLFFFWHMYWWEMESACQDEVSGRCGLHSPHTQPPSIPAFMCLYLPTAYPSTLCAYLHPPLSSEGGGGGVSSKGDKKRPRKRSFYPQLNGARGNPYQIQGLSTEKEPFPSCF